MFGIYILGTGKDRGWMHGTDGDTVLVYESLKKAKSRAMEEYGYDDYDELVADGWCQVRFIGFK